MKLSNEETTGLTLLLVGLAAAILSVPGLLVRAGPAPLSVLFGWGAPVVVVALLAGGLAFVFTPRLHWQVRWWAIAGAELLFAALLSIVHLTISGRLTAALDGRGGGLVGWAVSALLLRLGGLITAWTVSIGLLLVSAWLLSRTLPPAWTAFTTRVAARILDAGLTLFRNMQPSVETDQGANGGVSEAETAGPAIESELPAAPVQPAPRRAATPTPARAAGRPRSTREAKPPAPEAVPAAAPERLPRRKPRPEYLPSLDVLAPDDAFRAPAPDARQRGQLLKQTLSEFGVPVEVVSIKEGPTVTQYGLEPGEIVRELSNGEVLRRRVSVATIMRLSNDLALALSASPIRIEAPVPGRPYVGVEVPNSAKTMVPLRGVIESKEFLRVSSPLAIALGRDVAGDPVVADLTRMPHLLIAGATGSGKSVCINAIVCSLLLNNGPETVRFLMVDPKMVELPVYNGIPHLLAPVVTDPAQATHALAWLTVQMDDRYRLFASQRVRNIEEFNRAVSKGRRGKSRTKDILPYIVLVIDELADLMMTAADDVERLICRLAQMARATGIHLVLATQRPSVDVITGLIKANFPARIAFAVTSQIDSRVVLDTPGAERLLGRGDMLFMAPDSSKLARVQGCFVSDREAEALVEFWRQGETPEESESAGDDQLPWAGMIEQEGRDDLLDKALALIETKKTVSTSLLQRQLHLGYPRAARLMEQLEEMGAVAPDEGGGKSRAVLYGSDGETE